VSGRLRHLAKHSVVYGIGEILSRVLGFLLVPLYTRFIPPEGYGALALLEMVITLPENAGILWLTDALFRFYAKFDDEQERQCTIASTLWPILIISLICALTLGGAAGPIGRLVFKADGYADAIRIIALNFFIHSMTRSAIVVMRIREESGCIVQLSLLSNIVQLSLNILFVVALGLGFRGMLLSQLVVRILNWLVLFPRFFAQHKHGFSMHRFRALARYGLPLIPNRLARMGLVMADRAILQAFLGLDDLGLYAVGKKYAGVVNISSVPIQTAWKPFAYNVADKERGRERIARGAAYYMALVSLAGLAIGMFAREWMTLLAPEYYATYAIIPVLVAANLFWILYDTTTLGISLRERTHYLPISTIIGAVANIGLNIWLVPRFGLPAAAFVMLATYFVMWAIAFVISQRLFPINYGRLAWVMGGTFVALLAGALWPHVSPSSIVLRGAVFVGYTLLAAQACGFWREGLPVARQWLSKRLPASSSGKNR